MKNLALYDILNQIGIVAENGTKNPMIKQVLNYAKKEIDDHTLVFHIDRERVRGKYWKDNHSVVIVTDQPELCTNLGDESKHRLSLSDRC
ncbi:hypothetical protein ACFFIX_14845 [Metabacillus herbersteinensis]|uniref:Uncharacterized protein n=1 Tax=Metabacillus herbersteinensis TaxID=283816 RepID=A0ABV6GGB8_9BACI